LSQDERSYIIQTIRITESKYYPRPTSSIIGRSCRGGSWSSSLGSPVDVGATISPGTRDGVPCSPTAGDGPPIEARDGIVWGEGDAVMFAEEVCIPVCGTEEDEEGICEGGTNGDVGAIGVCNSVGGGWKDEDDIWIAGIEVGLCNPVGGVGKDKDDICKADIDVVGLSGIRRT